VPGGSAASSSPRLAAREDRIDGDLLDRGLGVARRHPAQARGRVADGTGEHPLDPLHGGYDNGQAIGQSPLGLASPSP
ncbi:MAG: hypothetical protein WA817_18865, partial [Candidatus Acidiferrum sp.]